MNKKRYIESFVSKFSGKRLMLSGGPWSHIFNNNVWKIMNYSDEYIDFDYAQPYIDEYGYFDPHQVDTFRDKKDDVQIKYFPRFRLVPNQLQQTDVREVSLEEFNHIRLSKLIKALKDGFVKASRTE